MLAILDGKNIPMQVPIYRIQKPATYGWDVWAEESVVSEF
jgi:hypothetical protein